MPELDSQFADAPERMRIGELARRSNVSHRTIHYYEEEGLLAPIERVSGSHRYYGREALARLHKIKQLQDIGLSLHEIRDVIDLYFIEPSGVHGKLKVIALLREQLADIDRKMLELQEFQVDVQRKIAHMEEQLDKIQ